MTIFLDIWRSFRRMPMWVQIWVACILMPVNFATLAFVGEPYGGWIAALAVMGMALNLPFIFKDRGFGNAMALPHVVLWTPAVVLALWALNTSGDTSASFRTFLLLFIVVDAISLAFDYKDGLDWLRGKRHVA